MSVTNYKELMEHYGHEIEIANYDGVNVAIECLDCCVVLLDFDNEESEYCEICDCDPCECENV